jgi:hypothetical protein
MVLVQPTNCRESPLFAIAILGLRTGNAGLALPFKNAFGHA